MRASTKIALLSIVALGFSVQTATRAQSQAGAALLAAGTVGDFIDGLRSVEKDFENSGHSLIDHGNSALGQQQMVLAGILTSLIQQLTTAYGASLGKTFQQISATERDTFSSIANSLTDVDKMREMTSSNIQDAIYKTQGAANQLLDRIPLGERYPIFYGMTVRDLTTDPSQNPNDIEILGFHFVDPSIDSKSPRIVVAGMQIPEQSISAQQDRIKVQLPDEVKKKIGFNSNACSPRPTFPVDIIVQFGKNSGIWPISWKKSQEAKFHANALAGAELYDVQVSYSANRTTSPLVSHSFNARSGYTAMGCEQTTSATVRFDLPPGSQEISCSAAWVDTSNVGGSNQNCTVGGTVATGSGSMRGRDKQCIRIPPFGPTVCNCPGGGHGNLQISGSYKVTEPRTEAMSDLPLSPITIIGQSNASVAFPADANLNVTQVKIDVRRKNCSEIKDQVIINTPDWAHKWESTSKEGLFKATAWDGQVTVGKTNK
ncbi:hypothetical protein SAMN02799625_04646 [Methylobacterium sp. UNC300MFChir4.1]|uniref:hypothetical protein n=1 Tax=Methylobacterium sp. UNC300MFChir4.1 TaxID=1502747 RepID=UPI0008D44B18|nr:hypothetical protein [Methylobacterium sp. UNC300MFChir4.1]SEP09314.1 hypothetical protein SAMN02799625_04646 [Methylobacterium sp. UNC300MFChir4.1]